MSSCESCAATSTWLSLLPDAFLGPLASMGSAHWLVVNGRYGCTPAGVSGLPGRSHTAVTGSITCRSRTASEVRG